MTTITPTQTQTQAIRAAMANNRILEPMNYSPRTLEIMARNGWILPTGEGTYKITPKAAAALKQYALSDRYSEEDLNGTPESQLQATLVEALRERGVSVFAPKGSTERVSVSVADLARLLGI